MNKLLNIIAPMNTPEDASKLSSGQKFKRLFLANYSNFAPTDLTVVTVLSAAGAALLFLFGIL
jgi:hypothetical protein